MTSAVVIGAGTAGLMAAEALASAGLVVTVCEAKPSFGRKFLMAGKSGLNLTKDEPVTPFMEVFAEARRPLQDIIAAFDAQAVQDWAQGLGQEIFTGSTGRVFPVVMKASPLLRAWLARLSASGVVFQTRWRWTGWSEGALRFETPAGVETLEAKVVVLALGGASWARLGSDGAWSKILSAKGVDLTPFTPANAGISVSWSPYMSKHFGSELKRVGWHAGPYGSRGEAVISKDGLEGGGIYSVSRGVREGHPLTVDLCPDLSVNEVLTRLTKPQGKASLSNHLRKVLRLSPGAIALLQEMGRPLPSRRRARARLIKALTIKTHGLRPMDEAISTAGGIPFAALDAGLMLRALPGVFVAGEMLDWEAPTGGYLISACLATGRWAGKHAAQWCETPRG
ncbi:MAG: TIGR03862 family flavoprotein [Pseudomonadota bacterium]